MSVKTTLMGAVRGALGEFPPSTGSVMQVTLAVSAMRKKPCRKGDGRSEDFRDEVVLVN
jgi:hypothetical protein